MSDGRMSDGRMGSNESLIKCHRTACPNPVHPCGWNDVTHGLYCLGCAHRIENSNMAGASLFPLLKYAREVEPKGQWAEPTVHVKLGKVG